MAEGQDRKNVHESESHRWKAHKDRKRWCGGKQGREHVPVVQIPPNLPGFKNSCRDAPDWAQSLRWGQWWCTHIVVCAVCGRHMGNVPANECPDRTTSS